jgi:hypothetical protein
MRLLSRSGRVQLAVLLAFAAVAPAALVSIASDPTSHDVAAPTGVGQVVEVTWTGISPPGANGTSACTVPGADPTEDHHTINLSVPAGTYDDIDVEASFEITWDPEAGADLILTVEHAGGAQSQDGGDPRESVVIMNPAEGRLEAIVCAFLADADTPYNGRLRLTGKSRDGGVVSPPAGPGNATGPAPRFQNYAPDYPKDGFGMFGGEATMAVNWETDSIFYLGFLETLRLRLDDSTSPALETWEKMPTNASSKATSDPIMVGDKDTNRIFAMQLLFPEGQSAMDYTDNDGLTWIPGMAGGFGSGADHQAMDVGPYPPGSTISHPLYPNAVYYCSQDIAVAFCSRSDDGGVTFGPIVPIYSQGNCNGLHGHVKVADDGVVYVPNSKCTPLGGGIGILSNRVATIVSENAGVTWTVRFVNDAVSGGGSDPSLASATDGTVYLAYTDANNRLHMVKSADHGVTWVNDVNIGELAGITAAEFPAVVAGDPDRAAVAFFGSTYPGEGDPEDSAGYAGFWHLFVATTYDGGQTWHVVDVTPDDPIQRGPICGGNYCRNLLDFFDAVIDPQGRVLVSYEDGCVGTCVQGGISQYTDQVVIARQSGGRGLFAANDPLVAVTTPGAPRIEGYRLDNFTYVEWPPVDNGGSPVTEYKVYRGTAAGAETLLKSVGTKTKLYDTTATDPSVTYYYRVTAVNAQGESAFGNELALPVDDPLAPTPQLACALPGWKVASDLVGEAEASPLTRDIREIYVSEPADMPGKLVVALRAAQAAPPTQNGANFQIYFGIEGVNDKTWRASVNSGGETLEYWDGTVELTDDTLDHQRVYTAFAEGLDTTASGFTLDGFVRFVLNKDALGLANGSRLLAVTGWSYPSSASSSNVTREESGYFDYTLAGNDFCEKGGIVLPPIEGPGGGPVVDNGNNRLGGAMPAGGLLLLAGLALLRRRRS